MLNEIIGNIKNKSLKKCIISSFNIPNRECDFDNGVTISDLYRELIEYAYEQRKEHFIQFREESLASKTSKFYKFFRPEDTSASNSKIVVTENAYTISTNYSNDGKLAMIRDLYDKLSLPFDGITVTLKYASLTKY